MKLLLKVLNKKKNTYKSMHLLNVLILEFFTEIVQYVHHLNLYKVEVSDVLIGKRFDKVSAVNFAFE